MKKGSISAVAFILAAVITLCSCNAGVITGSAPSKANSTAFVTEKETESEKKEITSKTEEEATTAKEAETTRPASDKETTTNKEEPSSNNKESSTKAQKEAITKKKTKHENKTTKAQATTEKEAPTRSGNCCTLTIECSDILNNMEYLEEGHEQYVPKDGFILKKTEFTFTEGETAYDLVLKAAEAYSIKISSRETAFGNYISGINNLDEFDVGKSRGWTSGWVYYINGEFAKYSSSKYILKNGDDIVFSYSCTYD